jgi:Phage integrase, N-terminal SAM-like domain
MYDTSQPAIGSPAGHRMSKKRRFGRVRQLPSGRYQARYPGPDGIDRAAPETFAAKKEAEIWLTLKEAEIRRGDWMDPDAGRIPFGECAQTWISDHVLKPRTEELYRDLLKNHLSPAFGNVDLRDVRESGIRRWRKERLAAGPRQDRPFGPVTVAKAYRLLHTVLNTAADDRLIRRNPCRIKGAGQEDSPERAVIPLTTWDTPAPGPHSSISTPHSSGTRPSRRARCCARRGARPGLRPGERAQSRHRTGNGHAAGRTLPEDQLPGP